MSTHPHTPGRLTVVGDGWDRLHDASGGEVANCVYARHPEPTRRANARHLAAAWNAAHDAELSTAALEAVAVAALLEACKAVDDGANWSERGHLSENAFALIDAAIALAEGGRP